MSICRAFISLPKTCQNCGEEFGCGGLCCWCAEIKLDKSVRQELKERFTDCLCRTCLEAAARDLKVPEVPEGASGA